MLFYLGVHDVDLVQWISGRRIVRVSSFAASRLMPSLGVDAEDVIITNAELEDGAVAQLHAGWTLRPDTPSPVNAVTTVVCTEGALEIDVRDHGLRIHSSAGWQLPDALHWPEANGRITGDLADQLRHFAVAVHPRPAVPHGCGRRGQHSRGQRRDPALPGERSGRAGRAAGGGVTGEQLRAELAARGVVAVLRAGSAERAVAAARALAAGGVTAVEVTFTVPDAPGAIAELAADESLLVGAGTVLTPDQADAAVRAGARFLVSPGLDDQVLDAAERLGVPALPGVFTPTEVARAARRCSLMKLFPASLGGPTLLAALRGPFPDLASYRPAASARAPSANGWPPARSQSARPAICARRTRSRRATPGCCRSAPSATSPP